MATKAKAKVATSKGAPPPPEAKVDPRIRPITAPQKMEALRKVAAILTKNFGVEIIFQGNMALTDGHRIIVPSLPDNAHPDLVDAMTGYVDHECGHIVETDFRLFDPKRRPLHADAKALTPHQIALAEEMAKALHKEIGGKPNPDYDGRVKAMVNVVEDVRMEHRMAERYRGMGVNLETVMRWVLKKNIEKWADAPAFFKVTCPMIVRAKKYQGYGYADEVLPQICDAATEELLDKVDDEIRGMHLLPDVWASYECARRILKTLDDLAEPPETEEPPGGGGGAGGAPDETSEEARKLAKDMLSEMAEEAKGLHEAMVDEIVETSKAVTGAHRVYTDEFDRTVTPDGSEKKRLEEYARIYEPVKPYVNVISSIMTRVLLAQAASHTLHARPSGTISMNTIARLRAGDPNIFKKKRQGRDIDTYVELFVDHSGSMSGSKIMLATQACMAMAEALDKVKVSFGITGFTCGYVSTGLDAGQKERMKEVYGDLSGGFYGIRGEEKEKEIHGFSRLEPLVEYQYKRADEAYQHIKTRLAAMPHQDMYNNADGDSILRVAKRVAQRPENRKLIITFSDGYPAYDQGPKAAIGCNERLKQVVQQISRTPGMEMVGIGIMSDAVRQFYPRSVVIMDVNKLPEVAMTELKIALVEKR